MGDEANRSASPLRFLGGRGLGNFFVPLGVSEEALRAASLLATCIAIINYEILVFIELFTSGLH